LSSHRLDAIVVIVILQAGHLAHVLKVGDGDDCNMARHIADKGVTEAEAMGRCTHRRPRSMDMGFGTAARLPPTRVNSELCRCR
jgi:hypothetical protein